MMSSHAAFNIHGGKEFMFRPPDGYQLSVLAIALNTGLGNKIEPTVVQVRRRDFKGELTTSTLCTLDNNCRHTITELFFECDDDSVFYLVGGQGPVSITGSLQPNPSSDEEDSSSDEEVAKEPSKHREGGAELEIAGNEKDDASDDPPPILILTNNKRNHASKASFPRSRDSRHPGPRRKRKKSVTWNVP